MGIAIASQVEDRTPQIVLRGAGLDPHLARASADFGALVTGGVFQGFETAAKLDQIAVAVLPIVEVFEVFDNFAESRGSPNAPRRHPTQFNCFPRFHAIRNRRGTVCYT